MSIVLAVETQTTYFLISFGYDFYLNEEYLNILKNNGAPPPNSEELIEILNIPKLSLLP